MTVKIMIRYGEIALKGKNRGQFERKLQDNLKMAIRSLGGEVEKLRGRFLISGPQEREADLIKSLARVFGVVSLSPVRESGLDPEQIKTAAAGLAGACAREPGSFRVKARRANKSFPLTSPQLNQLIGAHLQKNFPGLTVDLEQPGFTLSIEIGYEQAYLYLDQYPGPGGLPVGSTGRGLLLLSGGIDSPVAGWLAMKRGMALEAVYFQSPPFTGPRAREKVVDLCRLLAPEGGKLPLHTISVTKIQQQLRERCPSELGIILLRRMMLRLAEGVCTERGLQALITGENLGQVASQTLESMTVIDKAAERLVLRPLLGMDKREIIALAEVIGSYEISIRPYEDCCTLFVPRSPATRPGIKAVEKTEAGLDLPALLKEAGATRESEIVQQNSI